MRAVAEKTGLDCIVASAGTADYHVNEHPDPRAVAIAKADGVDITGMVGRQIAPEDFYRFTYIFAMDTANMAGLRAKAPRDATAKISLLLDAVDGQKGKSVPDPYYGDDSDFRNAWDQILIAVTAVNNRLEIEGANAEF